MLSARPFADDRDLVQKLAEIWWSLDETDWREAFQAHPRIGDVNTLREKFADTKDWASGEQFGVRGAADETLDALAQLNQQYLQKFGYIFIVCATGKTAEQMLDLLKRRLGNSPEDEIRVAAGEQLRITQLRLRKLQA